MRGGYVDEVSFTKAMGMFGVMDFMENEM